MTDPSIPRGKLKRIRYDFTLAGGWIKMPLDAILFNDRLTNQAKQLWGWLASSQLASTDISWYACESKMKCGTKARRNCLSQLVEEGFITISRDGQTITLHDPVKVYQFTQENIVKDACKKCKETIKQQQIDVVPFPPQPKPLTPSPVLKTTTTEHKELIKETWNQYKPDSYSKIMVLSDKQYEAVNKHLTNLGIDKSELKSFIIGICNGIPKSTFWSKTVDRNTRNFKAVFGYGNPGDTKMKNIENLYTLGNTDETEIATTQADGYTDQQQILLDELKAIDYQIMMNDPDYHGQVRFQEQRQNKINQLAELGIIVEDN
jgi:hypothetical protein